MMENKEVKVVEENVAKDYDTEEGMDTGKMLKYLSDNIVGVASSLSESIKNTQDLEEAKRSSFVAGYACGMADSIQILDATRSESSVAPFVIRTVDRFNGVVTGVTKRDDLSLRFELTQE